MVTVNSSSVADIRLFSHFVMLVSRYLKFTIGPMRKTEAGVEPTEGSNEEVGAGDGPTDMWRDEFIGGFTKSNRLSQYYAALTSIPTVHLIQDRVLPVAVRVPSWHCSDLKILAPLL